MVKVTVDVNKKVYEELKRMGNPSEVAGKVLKEWANGNITIDLDTGQSLEDKVFELEKEVSFLIAEVDKVSRENEMIKAVLRKHNWWR